MFTILVGPTELLTVAVYVMNAKTIVAVANLALTIGH
jgi:hypothetical protein